MIKSAALAATAIAAAAFVAMRRLKKSSPLTLGYWKIRGLAAPPRMMMYYAGQPFVNKAFGDDAKTAWFGGDKKALAVKNGLINLPYVIDGEEVVTQSNSVLVYLGQRLGIDKAQYAVLNHQVLDQVMDLRNDTMKIAYPFSGTTKEMFPAALETHMQAAHFKKLEAFCKGPYMCGAVPQSADFHVWEMVDQHIAMCTETKGAEYAKTCFSAFPKLLKLHAVMKAEPKLAAYFASDMYTTYAVNNPMVPANFAGAGYGDGPYGPTVETLIEF